MLPGSRRTRSWLACKPEGLERVCATTDRHGVGRRFAGVVCPVKSGVDAEVDAGGAEGRRGA